MNREAVNLVSVQYDVDIETSNRQPDMELLIKFARDGKSDNMCIEYGSIEECYRRRRILQNWISNSDYSMCLYLKRRKNKLYVIREKGNN